VDSGDESAVMLDAHVEAGVMVGVPFSAAGQDQHGLYDFGAHGGITRRVTELGAVMLKHRLTPVSNSLGVPVLSSPYMAHFCCAACLT
jgi:hypothetical protein